MPLGEPIYEVVVLSEEEAREKIRRFVDDPHLKFHFSPFEKLKGISEKGILSVDFADRIGYDLPENLSARNGGFQNPDRTVSIVDRDKMNTEGITLEEREHWVSRFSLFSDDSIGYLLPSDINILDYTPHTNESLVPRRINPRKIEGLFIVENAEWYEPITELSKTKSFPLRGHPEQGDYTVYVASVFLGLPNYEDLDELLPGIADLKDADLSAIREYSHKVKWEDRPDEYRERVIGIRQQIADLRRNKCLEMISALVGKPAEEVTQMDLITHYAYKMAVPLYGVNKEITDQYVIWPESEE